MNTTLDPRSLDEADICYLAIHDEFTQRLKEELRSYRLTSGMERELSFSEWRAAKMAEGKGNGRHIASFILANDAGQPRAELVRSNFTAPDPRVVL